MANGSTMRTTLLLAVLIIGARGECTGNILWCGILKVGSVMKDAAVSTVKLSINLTSAGHAILSQAADVGAGILTQGAKAIAGTIGNSLAQIGKREIKLPPSVVDMVQEGRQLLKNLVSALEDKLQATIAKLMDVSTTVVGLGSTRDVLDEVDGAVSDFKSASDMTMATVARGIESVLARVLGHELTASRRRGISVALPSAVAVIQDALKAVTDDMAPLIQTIVRQVADLGKQVKDQASVLVDTVKQSVTDLSSELTDRVLTGHGQDWVQHDTDIALSEA